MKRTLIIVLAIAAVVILGVVIYRRKAHASADVRKLSADSPPGAVSQLMTTDPNTGLPIGSPVSNVLKQVGTFVTKLPSIGAGKVADVPQSTPKPNEPPPSPWAGIVSQVKAVLPPVAPTPQQSISIPISPVVGGGYTGYLA